MTDQKSLLIPTADPAWALFLDVDGTLLEIAARPDAVTVPAHLPSVLARASAWLDGALAIASGRRLSEIDRLLSPLSLPCAAEHGAIIRSPDGTVHCAGKSYRVPADWQLEVRAAAREWPGVLLEEKQYSLAVHFRGAPERECAIRTLVERLVGQGSGNFEVLSAKMAVELRHRSLTKAIVVDRLMAERPFCGRVPVFVGDDVTDEDGFRAAREKGGMGLNVHETFAGQPAVVRRWLETFRATEP